MGFRDRMGGVDPELLLKMTEKMPLPDGVKLPTEDYPKPPNPDSRLFYLENAQRSVDSAISHKHYLEEGYDSEEVTQALEELNAAVKKALLAIQNQDNQKKAEFEEAEKALVEKYKFKTS